MRRRRTNTLKHKRSRVPRWSHRSALTFLMVITVLLICLIPGHAQLENRVAWILVIDTSKSMIGAGGAEDIFSRVKSVVKDFVRKAKNGDTVVIYTFDRRPTLVSNVEIKGSLDRIELSQTVDGLVASGMWTHTGDAVEKAFERSDTLKDQEGNPDKPVAVVIFTDDKEHHEPHSHSTLLSQIPLNREMPYPYTFVVWLNKQPPPAEVTNFVDHLGDRGYLERVQDFAKINDIRERVLEFLPPVIAMNPSSLFFGNVDPGAQTDAQTLNISTNRQTSLRVGLEGQSEGITLAGSTSTITLKPGENSIPLSLQTTRNLKDGIRDAKLVFVVDELVNGQPAIATAQKNPMHYEILVSLNVAYVPWWKKAARWTAYSTVALLFVWVIFFAYTGKHPTEAWVDHSRLEGELVVVSPESIAGNKHISLKEEGSSTIKLSALQVGRLKEFLDGDDAKLTTTHENGDKLVKIEAQKGNLYVGEQRVVSTNLYDGDLIQLGRLNLLFSSLNKRPANSEYELSLSDD